MFAIPRRRRAAAALAAGVLLPVLAAACGGSGGGNSGSSSAEAPARTTTTSDLAPAPSSPAKARYEVEMKVLGTTLGASLRLAGETELAAAKTKTARQQDVRALRKAQAALRAAVVTLRKIRPPADVRRAQALLIKGVEEYATELDSVISKLEAGGAPVTVLQQILHLKGVEDMQRASVEIAEHGYSIVPG